MTDLVTDLTEIKRLCAAQEKSNDDFCDFVESRLGWSDRKLDAATHAIAREIAAQIDCTLCANCCCVYEVSLDAEDITRLAEHLELSDEALIKEYGQPGTVAEQSIAQRPCPFLYDNRCTVYKARPRDCREYPHLTKKDVRGGMYHIITQAEECPVIFNTLQRMKHEFRPKRER